MQGDDIEIKNQIQDLIKKIEAGKKNHTINLVDFINQGECF